MLFYEYYNFLQQMSFVLNTVNENLDYFKSQDVEGKNTLFDFGATKVKVKALKKGGHKFSFKLKNCSDITYFQDRPDRMQGQLDMTLFAEKFREKEGDEIMGYFADDESIDYEEPNAVITHWSNNKFNSAACEIDDVKINKKGRVVITTDLLSGNLNPDHIMPNKIDQLGFTIDISFSGHPSMIALDSLA